MIILSLILVLSSDALSGSSIINDELCKDELVSAAAWIAPSFLIHTTLHEGSHAIVGAALGAQITDMSIVPGIHNGAFSFGYTYLEFKDEFERDKYVKTTLAAPVFTEFAWTLSAALTYRLVKKSNMDIKLKNILKGVLLTEMLAGVIDMTRWWASSFSKTGDSYSVRQIVIPIGAVLIPLHIIGLFFLAAT